MFSLTYYFCLFSPNTNVRLVFLNYLSDLSYISNYFLLTQYYSRYTIPLLFINPTSKSDVDNPQIEQHSTCVANSQFHPIRNFHWLNDHFHEEYDVCFIKCSSYITFPILLPQNIFF
jgi:hypothetical protein